MIFPIEEQAVMIMKSIVDNNLFPGNRASALWKEVAKERALPVRVSLISNKMGVALFLLTLLAYWTISMLCSQVSIKK